MNIVHWFNPLVWIALAALRRDLEVMCDMHVLRIIDNDRRGYASTLLRIAQAPGAQNPRLVTALLGSATCIKRRIKMIVRYKKNSTLYTALALLLTIAVALTGCTAAMAAETNAAGQVVQTDAPVQTNDTSTDTQIPSAGIEAALISAFSLESDRAVPERDANIKKAVGLLSGAVIAPGQQLSLNSVLGERTQANGWKAAPVIVGSVYVENYGAGVDAVTTALYNAAIRAELTVVKAQRHAMMPADVPGGLDATVSTGGPDLIIGNPYETDVTVQARFENNCIVVEIYGPPLAYSVDFASKMTGTTPASEETIVYNAQSTPDGTPIAPGESCVWAESRPGQTFDIYKIILDENDNEISRSLFDTYTYRGIQGIVYVNGPEP